MEKAVSLLIHMSKCSIFLILFSCSHSSLKITNPKNDWNSMTGNKDKLRVFLDFKATDKSSKHYEEYWGDRFKHGFVWGESISIRNKEPRFELTSDSGDCNLIIEFSYDGNSFSSWKTWVSGLSVFLIPVEFENKINVKIKSRGNIYIKTYEVSTWTTLFLIPAFPFTSSTSLIYRRLGDQIAPLVYEHCNGN